MKKQILILFLALLAFVPLAWGQAVNYSDPRPLVGCNDDPLSPIAGKLYNYGATATPSGGDFTFWATQDANLRYLQLHQMNLWQQVRITTPLIQLLVWILPGLPAF